MQTTGEVWKGVFRPPGFQQVFKVSILLYYKSLFFFFVYVWTVISTGFFEIVLNYLELNFSQTFYK